MAGTETMRAGLLPLSRSYSPCSLLTQGKWPTLDSAAAPGLAGCGRERHTRRAVHFSVLPAARVGSTSTRVRVQTLPTWQFLRSLHLVLIFPTVSLGGKLSGG